MELNGADWAIIAIILVSALISLMRGFVREALSLGTWVLAFVIAVSFHQSMESLLTSAVSKPYVRELLAYVILFGGGLLIGGIATNLLVLLVEKTGLSGTDRMLGMVFGGARGFIVVLVLVIMAPAVLTDIDQDLWWQQSALIPEFQAMQSWSEQTFSEIADAVSAFWAKNRTT